MCPAGRELQMGTGVEVVASLLISIFFLPMSADKSRFSHRGRLLLPRQGQLQRDRRKEPTETIRTVLSQAEI